MGIKHINFLFLCLFSLEFFSLTKVDLTDIPKSEEEEVIVKTKILKDSIVFIDKENEFNFSGFKQKGIYVVKKRHHKSKYTFSKKFEFLVRTITS